MSFTFGTTAQGNSGDDASPQQYLANSYAAPQACVIQSVSLYTTVAGQKFKLAVFADSGGKPATLLAQTAELTAVAGGWVTGSLIGPVQVASGQAVWLVMISSPANILNFAETPGGLSMYYYISNYPNLDSIFLDTTHSVGETASMYVTANPLSSGGGFVPQGSGVYQ